MKKKIHTTVEITNQLNDTNLERAAEFLLAQSKIYSKDAILDVRIYSNYGGDDIRIDISDSREETDKEYEDRLKQESLDKMRAEIRERAEYERLKQKFNSNAAGLDPTK